MTSKISWWSRASTEQKLAQIDGGIECGMTAKQIAKNLRVKTAQSIYHLGNLHGRHFPTTPQEKGRRGFGKLAQASGILTARRWRIPDSEISSAFTIFSADAETPMFDEVPA